MNATTYPKIRNVRATSGKTLWVIFENGAIRLYDCTPLLEEEVFHPLRDEAVFRCAHADPHGYGVVWNDDVDLAESEIWNNGKIPENSSYPDER